MSGGKRVAVLGAGASGLVAIKCCLDEDLIPVCYERTNDIGGLWNFSENAIKGQGCVMKTTVINTSKEMMTYSDFPVPKELPNYMHNRNLMDYFRIYADNFKLHKYIKFDHEVVKVKQNKDFSKTGQWDLTIKDLKTGEIKTEVFDAVLVGTGHHSDKNMAKFPGEETFKGLRVHTHDYRDHRGYEDKRVVVIGIGNSGGDVAVELSKIAKQVYLSTRRGTWVFNRVGKKGCPLDMNGSRRVKNILPRWLVNSLLEFDLTQRFDHATYGLKPNHKVLSSHPMINDELPNRIICGTVKIKPNVRRITETGVEFDDDTYEDNIDVIIYATGYVFGFPFIDHPAMEVQNNKLPMYKFAFPPDLEHHTLAVLGYVQPWGAINPISEIQARLACRVFKGLNKLPSREAMWADIKKKQKEMEERYTDTKRHTIQVDFIPIMDELATLVGCRPNIGKLWLTDPKLAMKVFFGPCTPYQYRLMGPGTWTGARQAIMTQWDRTYYPLHVQRKDKIEPSSVIQWPFMVVLIAVLACLLWWHLN